MPNKKKNIKVRDLKPNKDAKGGGGFKPQGGTSYDGGQKPQGGTAPQGGGPANS
jgi:hypothetical protein